MSLQISTREHDSNRPGVRIGAVSVEGESVSAEFMFGGAFRATREQAERQARMFVAAQDMLDALKLAEQVALFVRERFPQEFGADLERIQAAICKAEGPL